VDCYNAGATMLHVHMRDPATGDESVDFDQFNYFIGGSSGRAEDDPASWQIDVVCT